MSIRGRLTATYRAWQSMRRRCLTPTAPQYPLYGGRGITICKRWDTFSNFLEDMGERPEKVDALSLGRTDNDGPYCKENCRWETMAQQTSNRQRKSKTNIVGVYWHKTEERYIAQGYRDGRTHNLYSGKDFFEACCVRKAWELLA